jgi:hypothetical protein
MARSQVLGVRLPTADQDAAGCIGTVTFGYSPTEFDPPLKLVKYGKVPDNAPKGTRPAEFDQVDFIGSPRAVKFHDCWVKVNDRGPYVQVGGWKLPREVLDEIAVEAAKKLHAMNREAKQTSEAEAAGVDPDTVFGN